jgi:hypothetical protein
VLWLGGVTFRSDGVTLLGSVTLWLGSVTLWLGAVTHWFAGRGDIGSRGVTPWPHGESESIQRQWM